MSRVDFGAKPLILPMPVVIIGTYDKDGVNHTYVVLGEVVGKAFSDGLQLK